MSDVLKSRYNSLLKRELKAQKYFEQNKDEYAEKANDIYKEIIEELNDILDYFDKNNVEYTEHEALNGFGVDLTTNKEIVFNENAKTIEELKQVNIPSI